MSSYEFSQQQNRTFSELSSRMTRVGIIVILAGLAVAARSISPLLTAGFTPAVLVSLLHSLAYIAIGIIIYRPADNLKRVVSAQGNDIAEVMTAMRELKDGIGLGLALIVLNLVILAAEFVGWGAS